MQKPCSVSQSWAGVCYTGVDCNLLYAVYEIARESIMPKPHAYFYIATRLFIHWISKTSDFKVSNQVIPNDLRCIPFTIYLDGLFESLRDGVWGSYLVETLLEVTGLTLHSLQMLFWVLAHRESFTSMLWDIHFNSPSFNSSVFTMPFVPFWKTLPLVYSV